MALEHDAESLREVLRQGARMLLVQDEIRESTFRRAAELLRLSVATIGGFLVVAGLFVSTNRPPNLPALIGFAGGVIATLVATGLFALVLNGARGAEGYACGLDLRRVLRALGRELKTPHALLRSLAEPLPDWIDENGQMLRRIERIRSRALGFLGLGVLLFTVTLIYMIGGSIHG